MPSNLVKTKKDEKLWKKAKKLAAKKGKAKNYKYINSIYQNLKGKPDKKKRR